MTVIPKSKWFGGKALIALGLVCLSTAPPLSTYIASRTWERVKVRPVEREIWNGGRQYDNVQLVKNSFPKTNLLLTEACNHPFSWSTFDQWHWGENYGENMIEDFNNGAIGWTNWNLVLDERVALIM